LREAGIPLDVQLAGEVRLHPDAFELVQDGELPIIGLENGQGTILLELPDNQVPIGAVAACRAFAKKGIRSLIAHPERNKEVMRDPMRLKPLIDRGCLLQVTAASVTGGFGKRAFQSAHQLLSLGWVAVVASDAHNLAHRPPGMREAREMITRRYGAGMAYRLTEETPQAVLKGL
jgi:protein-tyrosine phosphatase